MPVSSCHPDYIVCAPIWAKIRTTIDGEEAVKRAERYLPRPSGMQDADYNNYRARAKFYAAAERTLTAFVGLVQRKPPVIRLDDDRISYLMHDVDGHGMSLAGFGGRVLAEILMMGRVGISADIIDGRAVMTIWPAETIINWQTDAAGALKLVVTRSLEASSIQDDPYVLETDQVYRVWKINTETNGVIYEKHRESDAHNSTMDSSVELRGPNAPLNEIPFVIAGTSGVDVGMDRSLLAPIVNLALHHYMLSADRNWGLHFSALPTPYILGISADHAPNAIGPTSLWAIPNENAKVGMLEFSGAGLREIALEMEDDKREIADMGARILESRAKTAEAADTVAMKSHSDSANLNTVCATVAALVTRVMRIIAHWLGVTNVDNVYYSPNRDFLPTKLDPAELTALVQAWLAGALSNEELYAALQEGEIVDPAKPFDVHLDEIVTTQASRGGITIDNAPQQI